MKKVFLLLLFICMNPVVIYAAPSISNVIGDYTHGESIVISGSDFGTKSPAAPLMWDDCESATAETFPSGSANGSSQVGYSDWQPLEERQGDGRTVPATHRIYYREFPYTPAGESGSLTQIAAPHTHSTKCLSAGHYFDAEWEIFGNNPARDISITIPNANGVGNFETHWYARWYYRVNSDWPECGTDPNHKTSVIQSDVVAYGGGTYPNDYSYLNFNNGHTPCHDSSSLTMRHSSDIGVCDDWTGDGANYSVTNPKDGWQIWEEIVVNHETNGTRTQYIDGVHAWGCDDAGAWFTALHGQGIGSFTIGGYFRLSLDYSGGEQSSDAHRLYDDIYVDSTLSRVILANHETYASSTIREPQIPSAWATDEITCTLNVGKLGDTSTVYLFVFDSDGTASSGYELTLGAPACTTTGTLIANVTESTVKNTGGTLIFTLTGATWETDIGTDCQHSTDFLAAIDSNKAEAGGWDAQIKAALAYDDVALSVSDTVATVTIGADGDYDITETETITPAFPASVIDGADEAVTSSTFTIGYEATGAASMGASYNASGPAVTYVAGGITVN